MFFQNSRLFFFCELLDQVGFFFSNRVRTETKEEKQSTRKRENRSKTRDKEAANLEENRNHMWTQACWFPYRVFWGNNTNSGRLWKSHSEIKIPTLSRNEVIVRTLTGHTQECCGQHFQRQNPVSRVEDHTIWEALILHWKGLKLLWILFFLCC